MYRSIMSGFAARAGLVQITCASILWGTAGPALQVIRHHTGLDPITIGFYRLAIAAATLLVLSAPRLRLLGAEFRSIPGYLVLTGIGLANYQALYFLAVAMGGVTVATVVSLGLAPVLTTGWESVRTHRRPDSISLLGVAAGICGLVLIATSTSHPTTSAPHPVLGLLAATGSGAGYVATTLVSRHLVGQVSPRTLTTSSATVGALVLLPLAAIGGLRFDSAPQPVGLLFYLGAITTAMAYLLFNAGLRSTAGSTAAVLTLMEPLTAALLAVLLLGEPLPVFALIGGVLMLAAVGLIYLRPGREGSPTGDSRASAQKADHDGSARPIFGRSR